MRRLIPVVFVLFCGCSLNFDPVDTAPAEALGEECTIAEDGSGHEAGHACSETRWFFTQPWAAKWYWGKIMRDSLILLALASAVTAISVRKARR